MQPDVMEARISEWLCSRCGRSSSHPWHANGSVRLILCDRCEADENHATITEQIEEWLDA